MSRLDELRDARGFNGAASFQRRKDLCVAERRAHVAQASMGPPLFRGGRNDVGARVGADVAASMGPPLFRGGRPSRHRVDPARGKASMGPPLFRGGRMVSALGGAGAVARLQWGRLFSEAEGGPRDRSNHLCALGFNGAASFQRRKESSLS